MKQANQLINETSPYLLQHAYNPVNWYAWSDVAFEKAKTENKPVFLSIGYSTCHWCHVMENESFEDEDVAAILNDYFISIKVDKEERPDIDSIYMNVCTALTGSGGWPLTIILTPDQKPFYAATYLPKTNMYGRIGLMDLLLAIHEKWQIDQNNLKEIGNDIVAQLSDNKKQLNVDLSKDIAPKAFKQFCGLFDKDYGGFGDAPKFPTPHHFLFLLRFYEQTKNEDALQMVEKTLTSMYRGGIFDHIGYGFSRYSTDRIWLVPHFEKMLYDNALLLLAYTETYRITQNQLYRDVANKIIDYVLTELTSTDGGFYCAQDADSEGVEGKYYVFTPDEIIQILDENDGTYFNQFFNITPEGNFEGENIPNLLNNKTLDTNSVKDFIARIYSYRKRRTTLHKDDKILTAWNALMICAFAKAYKVFNEDRFLNIAQKAVGFIEDNLCEGNDLFVSYREGKKSGTGFLDDYAFYIWARIELYEATLDENHLKRAVDLTEKTISEFWDDKADGFFLYGKNSEQLIMKPKETYDGAIPSGNSVMTYNLILLSKITKRKELENIAQKQINFMIGNANSYPMGNSFFLYAYLYEQVPYKEVVCVLVDEKDLGQLKKQNDAIIKILRKPTKEYPLKNNKTTFYVCDNFSCQPPVNEL